MTEPEQTPSQLIEFIPGTELDKDPTLQPRVIDDSVPDDVVLTPRVLAEIELKRAPTEEELAILAQKQAASEAERARVAAEDAAHDRPEVPLDQRPSPFAPGTAP